MNSEYTSNKDDLTPEVEEDDTPVEINEFSDSETEESEDKNTKSKSTTEGHKIDVLPQIPKRTVPNLNVPEKIIFCIDTCQSENYTSFEIEGASYSPLKMFKRITEFFLYTKQCINQNTEFALMILKEDEPIWLHNFTKNIIEIIIALDSFDSEVCNVDEFDLSTIFNLVKSKVNLPEVCADYKVIPPSNVVRLILMYSRSTCLPKLLSGAQLSDNDYFTVDVLYSHEENCSEHKCEEIYDALQNLDDGYSYIFEVIRNATKIRECAAKLLAHPLQRPQQKNTSYNFLNK